MADLRDYTKKNPVFVGTDGIRLPTGNNAQRTASSNVAGTLRYNTDINGIETYTSSGWRPLAAPPSISTVTPTTYNGESGTQFIINGDSFTPDAQVYFVTANGTPLLASSVSYYSAVQIRATTPRAITVQEEPISVRVTQQSGTTTLSNCIDAGGVPNWITTAGTLGSIFGANTVNVYVTATDPEGTAISYQLSTGSLPNGLNLSANGLIQGLANSVLANTTYNFVIKANDTVNNNTDRSFSYTILNRAPVINTAAGSLGTIYSGNAVPTATISAYDPDGGQLTYSIASGSLPANTGLGSANGVIQGTPVIITSNATYTFSVRTTDEGSLTASNTYTYTVLNRPPIINTAAGSLGTIYSGNAINATIQAYDPDGAAVSYAITSGNLMVTANIGTSNGVITASNDLVVLANTTYSFTVRATDAGNDYVSNNYTFTVLNRPPLWNTAASLPSTDANYNNTITINAYDPDGGSITYSLISGSLPSGLSLVTSNGTIVGTAPEVESNTTSSFTVSATDAGNDANTQTFSLTITPIIDSNFSNTVLLLKTTSSNVVTKDSSVNRYNVVPNGDTHAVPYSPFNTSWSANFGSQAGNILFADNEAFTLGSADFTIEFWWWPTSVTAETDMMGQWSSGETDEGWLMYCGGTYAGFFYVKDGTTDNYVQSTTKPNLYKWNHIAAVRNNNTISYYINGTRTATVAESGTISNSSRQFSISGRSSIPSYGKIPGYISNFRIVKGNGNNPYNATSATLTVPTSPLTAITGTSLLLFNRGNGFYDQSSNALVPTSVSSVSMDGWSPFDETDTTTGSMYFDGSGDTVTIPYAAATFGANDFTVECWAWFNSVGSYIPVMSNQGGADGNGWVIYLETNNTLSAAVADVNGGNWNYGTGSTVVPFAKCWNHIILTRTGNRISLFLNGSRIGTNSGVTGSLQNVTGGFNLGYYGNFPGGARVFTGYISSFRSVKGSYMYDANTTSITVPTSPLSNVVNTAALSLQYRQPHNNHTFLDNSKNKLTFARYGNASQGTFTPFSNDPGKWSNYFGGSSGIRFADNAAFQFGTNAFTVEGWFNVASTPANDASIISKWVAANDGNSSWMVDFQNSNLSGAISIGGTVTRITGTSGVPLGIWNHFAFVRSGSPGTLSLFLNGTRIATATPTGSLVDDTNALGIGVRGGTDGYYLTGSLSNIRVVNGTAVYDPTLTTHIVPTSPLTAITNTKLLTCQNNQFIDNSTANSSAGFTATAVSIPFAQPYSPFAANVGYSTANTGGSLYLDGSGDYLISQSISNGQANAFRTGPFSIEAWHYGTTTSGGGHIISSRSGSVNDASTITAYVTGGQYSFYGNGNHVAANYVSGQWNHVVFTRDSSNTLRNFINGKLVAYEASYTPDITAIQYAIGSLTNGGEIIPACWISDIRLVNGYIPTSYQTSSTTVGTQIFTPPTSPITISSQGAQSNAVCLLMNFTDAAVLDYSKNNTIETLGDAKANNLLYKFSNSSLSLDGTGDYLTIKDSDNFYFQGDFTCEYWIYPVAGNGGRILSQHGGSGTGVFLTNWASTGTSNFYFANAAGSTLMSITSSSGSIPALTWTHVAYVRYGNVFTIYVNGVANTSTTAAVSLPNVSEPLYIGAYANGPSEYFYGSLSDIRITKSARYTANFTPPTRSFPNR